MSYNDLLEEEGEKANYLVVLKPARNIDSGWALESGATYSISFTLGFAVKLVVAGLEFTLASSSTLGPDEWFYDDDLKKLFIRFSLGTNPNDEDFIIVTYELFMGTQSAHWHRIPTDDTTTTVYWEPIISRPPAIQSGIKDVTFGFLPTKSTNMTLTNAEHIYEEHLFISSFSNKDIDVYHWLGDKLDTANINIIFTGQMTNPDYNDSTLTIDMFDAIKQLEQEFRSQDTAFYALSDFTDLDPNFKNKPIPYVYGRVDKMIPVNVDYTEESPTTSDNRVWAIRAEGANNHDVTRTVVSGSTATLIKIDDATGLSEDDSVWLDKTTDEYRHIKTIDYGLNQFTVDALSSGAPVASDTVKRGTVGNFNIDQAGQLFRPHFNRDWTESVDATGTLLTTFSSSLESNLSMPNNLTPGDIVNCRVYGKKNDVTLGGSPFGSDDTLIGNLTALPIVLFDLLVNFLGLDESVLNTASFTTLLGDTTESVGFAIPRERQSDFPKFKELVIDLLRTGLVKFYQDFDLKWKVTQTKPITATSKEVDSTEILDKSIAYQFDYKDIDSDFIVEYDFKESNNSGTTVSSSSDLAKFLHGVTSSRTVQSLHIFDTDAQTLADRLKFTFGDQQGIININVKNRFFDNIVDDDITVKRTKLPGFEFDEDIERERDFAIISIDKQLRRVRIVMSDQKGIQDNSGSW